MGYDDGILVEPEQLPGIVAARTARGDADENLRALLGGNLMRLARTVWKDPRGDGWAR